MFSGRGAARSVSCGAMRRQLPPERPNYPHAVFRIAQLAPLIGVSTSTIRRWVRLNKFPPPIRLGEQSVAWRRRDIDAWLSERPDARSG